MVNFPPNISFVPRQNGKVRLGIPQGAKKAFVVPNNIVHKMAIISKVGEKSTTQNCQESSCNIE